MKVKIGPYKYPLTIKLDDMWIKYNHKKPHWQVREKDYSKVDKFVMKVNDGIQWIIDCVYNKFKSTEQKISVRIDKHDTYDMYTTLAHIILPMLKQLKQGKHGAPAVDIKDVPVHLRPSAEDLEKYRTDGTTDDLFFKRWDWVMDEMIFAFETVLTDWEEQFYTGECDFQWHPVDKDGNAVEKEFADFYEVKHGPKHTMKIDFKEMKKFEKRMDNGFKLFGKYYRNLWD